jgi:uncharacterized membrane protein
MNTIQGTDVSKSSYHVHWHVLIIHFPISFFIAAFGFQILHLFTHPICFELSTNVALVAGTLALIPATWTGWRSWKNHYKGAHIPIFQKKIIIAFIMLGLSLVLSVWRVTFINAFENNSTNIMHWLYFLGNILLMLGASAEGYYGGRLNHR